MSMVATALAMQCGGTNWTKGCKMRFLRAHLVSLVIAFLIVAFINTRTDVVSYTSFRIEPTIVESAQQATLYMSVEWLKVGCTLSVEQKVWSRDGVHSYAVDSPYTATMKDVRRLLSDKPRPIVLPALAPGEYEIGFSRVDGNCWPWEVGPLAIHNALPPRAKFTVK